MTNIYLLTLPQQESINSTVKKEGAQSDCLKQSKSVPWFRGLFLIIPVIYVLLLIHIFQVETIVMEPIDLDGLRASVVKQGGIVRQLKKDGATQEAVTAGSFSSHLYHFQP